MERKVSHSPKMKDFSGVMNIFRYFFIVFYLFLLRTINTYNFMVLVLKLMHAAPQSVIEAFFRLIIPVISHSDLLGVKPEKSKKLQIFVTSYRVLVT